MRSIGREGANRCWQVGTHVAKRDVQLIPVAIDTCLTIFEFSAGSNFGPASPNLVARALFPFDIDNVRDTILND